MATHTIPSGSPIISVDAKFLITIQTVQKLFEGKFDVITSLNEQAALALFLAFQRVTRIENGFWNTYIDMIPKDFNTVAANLPPTLFALLPYQIQAHAKKQMQTFDKDYDSVVKLVGDSIPAISKEEYRWAWFAVNTRCITLNTTLPTTKYSAPKSKAKKGTPKIALAPFLDMLNHSPTAKINANFDPVAKAFVITALEEVSAGTECFITYGAHDNAFLLAEYGFVISDPLLGSGNEFWVHNQYDFVSVDREIIGLEVPGEKEGLRERIMSELEGAGLFGDYTLHLDQESYRVMNALRLYACMTNPAEFKGQLNRWKMVVNGQLEVVSPENERITKGLLKTICTNLILNISESINRLDDRKSGPELGKDGEIQMHFVRTVLESALSILKWNESQCK
ncbi:SET domain-containing protein [Rhizoclosmatium globosum]|uniref:SET domain-containing protein n=1 Tax=Rhizoclosmatium globosum TaxID=329046 RepID=A0A1Y2D578_9FUNG|nr:SET domain-containing protein [Rhizoclosmatium globosum]|eukprot:ORY53735.1 SET domain-containing protein [Rhizoclosmatium globosum]